MTKLTFIQILILLNLTFILNTDKQKLKTLPTLRMVKLMKTHFFQKQNDNDIELKDIQLYKNAPNYNFEKI